MSGARGGIEAGQVKTEGRIKHDELKGYVRECVLTGFVNTTKMAAVDNTGIGTEGMLAD